MKKQRNYKLLPIGLLATIYNFVAFHFLSVLQSFPSRDKLLEICRCFSQIIILKMAAYSSLLLLLLLLSSCTAVLQMLRFSSQSCSQNSSSFCNSPADDCTTSEVTATNEIDCARRCSVGCCSGFDFKDGVCRMTLVMCARNRFQKVRPRTFENLKFLKLN